MGSAARLLLLLPAVCILLAFLGVPLYWYATSFKGDLRLPGTAAVLLQVLALVVPSVAQCLRKLRERRHARRRAEARVKVQGAYVSAGLPLPHPLPTHTCGMCNSWRRSLPVSLSTRTVHRGGVAPMPPPTQVITMTPTQHDCSFAAASGGQWCASSSRLPTVSCTRRTSWL